MNELNKNSRTFDDHDILLLIHLFPTTEPSNSTSANNSIMHSWERL